MSQTLSGQENQGGQIIEDGQSDENGASEEDDQSEADEEEHVEGEESEEELSQHDDDIPVKKPVKLSFQQLKFKMYKEYIVIKLKEVTAFLVLKHELENPDSLEESDD